MRIVDYEKIKLEKLADFDLIADDYSLFLYVKYPDEVQPRYMIHIVNHSCTCTGWAIRQKCKHLTEYEERLERIADKLKDLIILK